MKFEISFTLKIHDEMSEDGEQKIPPSVFKDILKEEIKCVYDDHGAIYSHHPRYGIIDKDGTVSKLKIKKVK